LFNEQSKIIQPKLQLRADLSAFVTEFIYNLHRLIPLGGVEAITAEVAESCIVALNFVLSQMSYLS
jgi:hypothetical protein